jgi:hypothetical protein
MSRYIDADKLRKDEIARCHCVPCVGSCDNNWKDLDEVLNDAPTADVVEVRHGRWIFNPDGTDWGIGAWKCSLCKCKNDNLGADNRFSPHIYAGSNFCPHCGAKMDEERKD